MTVLTLPDTRLQNMRIASMFYRGGLNTAEIGKVLSLPEAAIWNRMDAARETWCEAVRGYYEESRTALAALEAYR